MIKQLYLSPLILFENAPLLMPLFTALDQIWVHINQEQKNT